MIGNKIKSRRIELGMTQMDLAKKMGYKSKSTINKIELGINDINQSKMKKMAHALEVPVDYLIDDNVVETTTASVSVKHLSKYAELLSKLSPKNQASAIQYIEFLKSQEDENV
jgi:transcriptional regulator with XRE-family HTH domain